MKRSMRKGPAPRVGGQRKGGLLVLGVALLLTACGDRHRAYNPAYANPQPMPSAASPSEPEASNVSSVPLAGQQASPSNPASVEARPLTPVGAVASVAGQSGQPIQAIDRAATIPADGRYQVQAGETLYAVSRRFGLPVRVLIDANDLTAPYYLRKGQRLAIPQPRLHRVAVGETLYAVARANSVQVSEVVRLNALAAPYRIVPGQQLVLPGPQDRQPLPVPSAGKTVAAPPLQTAAAPGDATLPRPGKKPLRQTAALPKAPEPQKPKAAAAGIPQPPRRQGDKFLWPLEGKVISRFGPRDGGQHNDGINILAPRGAPVRAAENGVVAYAGEDLHGFGKLLLIKHADGWVTAYAHNDGLLVARGDTVKRGQTIARVGSSGNVARPQLHFELRRGTEAINPQTLLTRKS